MLRPSSADKLAGPTVARRRADRTTPLSDSLASCLPHSWLQSLRVDRWFERGDSAFHFFVEPQFNGQGVSVVIQPPARWERKQFLDDARGTLARVCGDRYPVKGDPQIISYYLEPLVIPAGQPRKNGVSREKVRPSLQRIGHPDPEFLSSLHDGRTGIRSKNIRPEFRARKSPAHGHHEIDGFPPLLFALARIGKDDVEGRANSRVQTPGGAFIDRVKVLERLIHQFQDFF